jgi:hypothetical protein
MRFRAMLNEIAHELRSRMSSIASSAPAPRRTGPATIHATSWAHDARDVVVAQLVICVLAFAIALLLARADALNAGLT